MSNAFMPLPRLRSGRMVDVLRGPPPDTGRRLGRVSSQQDTNGVATVTLAVGDPPDEVLTPNVRFHDGMQLTVGDLVWWHMEGPTAFIFAKVPPPAAESIPAEVNLRGLYTDWIWDDSVAPASPGWAMVDVPMSPQVDASPAGIFYSQQFPTYGPDGGYIGLQTSDPWRDFKIAISSMFGTILDAVPGNAAGRAVFGPTAADGGPGSSTWIPYQWMAGKEYIMRLAFDGTPAGKTATAGPWYSSYVMERDWGTSVYVATLISRQQVPTASGMFGDPSNNRWTNFTEYYGPKPHRCKDIPYSRCWFGAPVGYLDIGGGGAQVASDHLNHPSGGEGCSNIKLSDTDTPRDGVIHEIGIR